MLDSAIIDVALGLALLYLVLSLASSAITEWIAALFGLRSKNLRVGVERLLGEEHARRVYGHPLIARLSRADDPDRKPPSYIDPGTLATALLDLLARDGGQAGTEADGPTATGGPTTAAKLIDRIDDGHPLKETLRALTLRGVETVDDLRLAIAEWFDEGMTRVSGWYRRRAQCLILVIGAAVTVAANASTLHLARDLWESDGERARLAALATGVAGAEMPAPGGMAVPELGAFPVGWEAPDAVPRTFVDWLARLFGWTITVAAVSLGAPFWFDLLGKVANLRATGGRRRAQT